MTVTPYKKSYADGETVTFGCVSKREYPTGTKVVKCNDGQWDPTPEPYCGVYEFN